MTAGWVVSLSTWLIILKRTHGSQRDHSHGLQQETGERWHLLYVMFGEETISIAICCSSYKKKVPFGCFTNIKGSLF